MGKPLSDEHPDVARVRQAAQALAEYYDSVQIFASRDESGEHEGTVNVHIGVGNWFARYGQVKDWVIKIEEQTRVNVRNEQ